MTARAPAARRGFTLIEVLVALAVFSVVAIMASRAMSSLVGTEERLRTEQARLLEINRALAWLSRDLESIAARPLRRSAGGTEPALHLDGGAGAFDWTRSGLSNPAGLKRSEFQRVAWLRTREGALARRHWPVLDGRDAVEPVEAEVLTGVTAFEIVALTEPEVTARDWPPLDAVLSDPEGASMRMLPAAVEARLTVEGFGSLRRLVVVGGGR